MEVKSIHDFFTEKQLQHIVGQMAEVGSEIVGYNLKTASEELAGYLGEHIKVELCVKKNNLLRKINLFIKAVPTGNMPKADFIVQNQFFRKEALVYEMLEEIQDVNHLNPWCTRAVIYNEKIIVMPDLSILGYRTHPKQTYFNQTHAQLVVSSLARFHASFANYFTKRNQTHPIFTEEHKFFNKEPFGEAPWLKSSAKVTYNILKEFSIKAKQYPANLEEKLGELYIKAYNSLHASEDTFNVIIHKDLWANNILFQYEEDLPINAVLVDFQLSRYAPPTFDLMSLLYMTTSREFRDCYENEILEHYFEVFADNLYDKTKKRLQELNYDFEGFLKSCQNARFFGLAQAVTTIPCVCLDPDAVRKTFDDPDTYIDHMVGDRSEPLVEYARGNVQYKLRLLEMSEEFVERYVLEH